MIMQATQERFFIFISKLEGKLKEFTEASIPELITINNSDTGQFRREYLRMKSAVLGQMENIVKKAREVKEEKITYFPYDEDDLVTYLEFRTECYDRFYQLEELYQDCRERIDSTDQEDYEVKYQKILDEYETIKDQFRCTQCGSPVPIEKIYFTTAYITCPACSTRNTFEPSSQAKMLEHLGRSLAEQRTAHLLKEYYEIPEKMEELHQQKHQLTLNIIFENDPNSIQQKTAQMEDLEKQWQELKDKAPKLYQHYLRAMFDEWNKINPDMEQEHEKFYTRLLNEYKTENYE
ncbi:MAG: hypothetical protein BGO42_15515 [Flavobacterium sp. 40-81]|nr:MAG: hypothetical protein ABS44_21160 [Chryseobacterium sp. SCN 40-13]OJV72829.1 MAG: hypothetical protein BGO42_15515 [Flavobacterium sp. 40-81]